MCCWGSGISWRCKYLVNRPWVTRVPSKGKKSCVLFSAVAEGIPTCFYTRPESDRGGKLWFCLSEGTMPRRDVFVTLLCAHMCAQSIQNVLMNMRINIRADLRCFCGNQSLFINNRTFFFKQIYKPTSTFRYNSHITTTTKLIKTTEENKCSHKLFNVGNVGAHLTQSGMIDYKNQNMFCRLLRACAR